MADLAICDVDLVPVLPAPLALARHPAAVYLARLAPSSRRVMRSALATIAELLTSGHTTDALELDWSRVGYQHAVAVRAVLAEGRAPSTGNRYLAAFRGVLRECWRLGYISAEECQRAVDVAPIRGTRLPRGRALEAGELKQLFEQCTSGRNIATGTRDAALLGVLYGAGLRRAEAVALDLADYDAQAGTLRVHGKGNRQRLAHVSQGARDALNDWIAIRGGQPGPLFWPVRRSGRMEPRRLTPQAVLYVTSRRARDANIRGFSPHDLRRTFVGDLLDHGVDLSTVQALAGHASVTTTARYDRRGEATKAAGARRLFVPYRPGAAAQSFARPKVARQK